MCGETVKRQEAAWKEVLAASDEEANERCMEEEKRKIKRYISHSKNEINKQFGKKINKDVNGNRKIVLEIGE